MFAAAGQRDAQIDAQRRIAALQIDEALNALVLLAARAV
jgi:hypothetical protein